MNGKKSFQYRLPQMTFIQILVHGAAWFLVVVLAVQAVTGNLSINPVQLAEQRTGRYAFYFLILTLACSPVNTLFGFRQAIKVRRTLGLYSFLFAMLHLTIFFGVDYGLDLPLLLLDVGTKKYILAGAFTMVILFTLAITSFDWWKRRLGKTWKRLHRLIYLAGITALLHFAWSRKGDLFGLQGNISEPIILSAVMIILLLIRVPPVKRRILVLRNQLRRKKHLTRRGSLPANGA